MNHDTIRKLSALCKRWEEITAQRADIEAQIEKLIAPETKTVEPVSNEIQIGDLVEVVSAGGENTVPADIGKGGVVNGMTPHSVRLSYHPQYLLPNSAIASKRDCRKVAAHAQPGVTP